MGVQNRNTGNFVVIICNFWNMHAGERGEKKISTLKNSSKKYKLVDENFNFAVREREHYAEKSNSKSGTTYHVSQCLFVLVRGLLITTAVHSVAPLSWILDSNFYSVWVDCRLFAHFFIHLDFYRFRKLQKALVDSVARFR